MDAKVVYKVEHMLYGDGDDRNGWYLVRQVICNGTWIDRKPVARFDCDPLGNVENTANAVDFSDYCAAGHVVGHRNLMGLDNFLKL
jgi:hypothetical protein